MKNEWKKLKKEILNNISDDFGQSKNPIYSNLDKGLDLLNNLLLYKTGIKKLDGTDEILDAFNETFFTKPGKINPLRNIVNKLESFLRKLKYIITGIDLSEDKSKNLMWFLKDLNLLVKDLKGNYPQLIESNLDSFKGEPFFLYDICSTYLSRNQLHNSPNWTYKEVYNILQSTLVVYLFSVLKHFNSIESKIGETITEDTLNLNYKNSVLSILSNNPSLKMLESDFGIKTNSFEDFEINVSARAKRVQEEKKEYLKDSKNFKALPIKFLPDINGVMSSRNYILIHGIATSGKSTILKKIGKDFLNKYNSPFVFYIQLGKLFDINKDSLLTSEINNLYKSVTEKDLNLSVIDSKMLVLLDGLDEVPDNNIRDYIINQILSLKKKSNIQLVLTSRTNDYITNNIIISNNFEKYELLPIRPQDIIALGEKIIGQGNKLNNFIKIVKKSELLNAFPKTPLTSILLAVLFKEKDINVKELPKNITELYGKFIDLFLNRWDKSRGISEQFKIQKKEFILQKIAKYLHENRMTTISSENLEKFIDTLAKKKPLGGPKNANLYLKRLCGRTNILIKDEITKSYSFFHLTIQEYLAASKFNHKDDNLLVEKFLDEWWLNPNIFYAGKKTEYPDIIKRVASLEVYPTDVENKFNYFAHLSSVLLAAHNLDNSIRNNALKSMLKIFNEFSLDLIKEFSIIPEFADKESSLNKKLTKVSNQSLLDIVLSLRNIFCEFFGLSDFQDELKNIWKEFIIDKSVNLSDITLYSLSFCLSINSRNPEYLEGFVLTDKYIVNPRWFRIIDVDISIKNLNYTTKPIKLKIRRKSHNNNEYIQKQFKERISRHYNSIIGVK